MSEDRLEELRRRLSGVNEELLRLLNDRLQLVDEVRRLKREQGQAFYDPEREEQMFEQLRRANAGPLTDEELQEFFRHVFDLSLSHMERRARASLRVHRRHGEPDQRLEVRGCGLGGGKPQLIAGPCSVESEEQLERVAEALASVGCRFLRGGAYKPRTSPYDFQGLGEKGWRMLRATADRYRMAVVSEVLDPRHLEKLADLVDVVQVGARNMFNYELLKQLGQLGKPVLLKRSFMATIEEFLLAAEYVASHGNLKIVLCERGIRTFERATRNTLDISAVALLKRETALPVVVDVAHAAGRRDILAPLAKAALAAGADGIMVEVHPFPPAAGSDRAHQLDLEQLRAFAAAVFG